MCVRECVCVLCVSVCVCVVLAKSRDPNTPALVVN